MQITSLVRQISSLQSDVAKLQGDLSKVGRDSCPAPLSAVDAELPTAEVMGDTQLLRQTLWRRSPRERSRRDGSRGSRHDQQLLLPIL